MGGGVPCRRVVGVRIWRLERKFEGCGGVVDGDECCRTAL